MQDNAESEKPEDENEDQTPETEETVSDSNEDHPAEAEETPEDLNSSESDHTFEEQEGEILHPEEKKKSGAGKVFLFLILILAGSGSYLYFNNLIPPEILNLVFPKSPPSKPPALITQTPPFMEEVAEIPEPVEVVEPPVPESPEPSGAPETHISGNEPTPTPHISGSDLEVTEEEAEETVEEEPQEEEEPQVVEAEPVVTKEEPQVAEKAEPAITEEPVEEVDFTEPVVETIPPPAEPETPQRSKASQAYLDFIESSVQKLVELIVEGVNWGWDYLKEKIA